MAALGASAAATDTVAAAHAAMRPDRRGRLALLLMAVLALHGWLLSEFNAARPQPAGVPAAPVRKPADGAARATTVLLRAAPPPPDAAAVSAGAPVAAPLAAPGAAAGPVDAKAAAGAAPAAQLRRVSARSTPTPAQADPPSTPIDAAVRNARATTVTSSTITTAPVLPTTSPVPAGPDADAVGGNRPAPDSTLATLTALAVAAPRRPSTAPPSQSPPPPPAGATPLPNTPPPSAELTYAVHRGPVAGKGRLVWRINPASASAPASYSLSLDARLPVLGVIFSETSSGGFDAHGLAPTRHTERRLRRSERALSITRDTGGNGSGMLSFSASTARLALLPGTQDRVSWLVQLAAVYGAAALPAVGAGAATARPAGLPAGLNLPVASVNGDLRLWVFKLLPPTPEAPGLLHLERRPAPGDFDTTAEVWLDPARHAWPVRVLLTESSGETMELRLERLSE
jgi:hypothetical protein